MWCVFAYLMCIPFSPVSWDHISMPWWVSCGKAVTVLWDSLASSSGILETQICSTLLCWAFSLSLFFFLLSPWKHKNCLQAHTGSDGFFLWGQQCEDRCETLHFSCLPWQRQLHEKVLHSPEVGDVKNGRRKGICPIFSSKSLEELDKSSSLSPCIFCSVLLSEVAGMCEEKSLTPMSELIQARSIPVLSLTELMVPDLLGWLLA